MCLPGEKVHSIRLTLFIISVSPHMRIKKQCRCKLRIKTFEQYLRWMTVTLFQVSQYFSGAIIFCSYWRVFHRRSETVWCGESQSCVVWRKSVLCGVEKVSPVCLQLFTTSTTVTPNNRLSAVVKKLPFLITITLDLPQFTVKHNFSCNHKQYVQLIRQPRYSWCLDGYVVTIRRGEGRMKEKGRRNEGEGKEERMKEEWRRREGGMNERGRRNKGEGRGNEGEGKEEWRRGEGGMKEKGRRNEGEGKEEWRRREGGMKKKGRRNEWEGKEE